MKISFISFILFLVLLIPCAIWAGEDDDFEENDKDEPKTPKDKEAGAKKALKGKCLNNKSA